MSDPLVPNFRPGVGRLATDRFDFQNHVDGSNFKHKANQIDLFTTLIIGGNPKNNVQDALAALTAIATPPTIQDATTFLKGIIQLTGDIGGVSTNVVVTGLQQRPISTLAPNTDDVLTWDGTNWTPAINANTFSANGDLSGDNISQQVIRITGGGFLNAVFVDCNNIVFKDTSSPAILQLPDTNDGENLLITAQGTIGTNKKGGNVIISGGVKTGTGQRGGITLQINEAETNMLQITESGNNRKVLSLLKSTDLSATEMPANTGDMVIYVADTATPPSSGSPVNGTILFSYGGKLQVKQADADAFPIGSLSNPSIWGPAGQQTYIHRDYTSTSTASSAIAFQFTLPTNTATYVEAVVVGKRIVSGDSAMFTLRAGYVRNGSGAPVALSTTTVVDSRNTGGASGWSAPTITNLSNDLVVLTGANSATTILWYVLTKLDMSAT